MLSLLNNILELCLNTFTVFTVTKAIFARILILSETANFPLIPVLNFRKQKFPNYSGSNTIENQFSENSVCSSARLQNLSTQNLFWDITPCSRYSVWLSIFSKSHSIQMFKMCMTCEQTRDNPHATMCHFEQRVLVSVDPFLRRLASLQVDL